MDTRPVVALTRHKTPDGVLHLPGSRYEMPALLVLGNIEAGHVFDPAAHPVPWFTAPGRVLAFHDQDEEPVFTRAPLAGSLKIVAGCCYDPGSAAFRLHNAVNMHTKHASAFVRWEDLNPHCSLRQYDFTRDLATVRAAIVEADVVHCHVNYMLVGNAGIQPTGLLIRHYHGSRLDGRSWVEPHIDGPNKAVLVGARLTHLAESERMHWLPIPMPVDEYRAIRREQTITDVVSRPFRVAHSPTMRRLKGTEEFLQSCDELTAKGIAIEPVLIEGVSLAESLRMKATCDAVFDSFWLGLQGSGLEGGAMELPVVAGDSTVAALYRQHVGYLPYTFAGTRTDLVDVLALLARDAEFRAAEASRLAAYVREYHDYPAVAARYERILAYEMKRDDVRTTEAPPTRTRPRRARRVPA